MMQFGSDRGVALPCSSNSVQSTNSPSSAAPAPIRKRRFSSAKIQPVRLRK
ncbi:unnamed protein product [Anisakis simplex]|uniref:Uncharacterized protein n=1 Tax=Anisakis simplex TaxID=6269 RepID=A0A0M3JG42_ANISI|nr:unnamed protein product [Anisakis simplex]